MEHVPAESALVAWLLANVPGFEAPSTMGKFAAGRSNPTYRLDAASGQYVLRRQPIGDLLPSAHAIDREFRLLRALWPTGFPVPCTFAYCEEPAVIGAPFYVMEHVEGFNYSDGTLPQLDRDVRRTIYLSMVDILARLHTIDFQAIGLADFGKTTGYLERQVKRWTDQYRRSQTERLDDMERLIEWLPSHIPAQTQCAIIHGDYRIDNLLFGTDGHVRAVIDWELSTIGDPLADFANFALQWILPADGMAALGGISLDALGIPTLGEIAARYSRSSGIPLPDLDWYFAFNLFRLTAIMQGIKQRARDGIASGADAAVIEGRIPMCAAEGWARAVRSGSNAPVQASSERNNHKG